MISRTLLLLVAAAALIRAGEGPYFVTYTHQLEEQGNLEFESNNILGNPHPGNSFIGSAAEFEYGLLGWWTTEFYLDGQTTSRDSAIFTGFRWENRFRLLPREHWINPLLYLEFEDTSGADKTVLEVVGHDAAKDLAGSNAEARLEKQREIEAKLLFGSNFKGWNVSENLIFEKNVAHAPWEFGYAIGAYRQLALRSRPDECNFCPENIRAGVEAYGGLSDSFALTLRDTSHYIAPVLQWTAASGVTFKISPGFGVTGSSAPFLLRFGVAYEVAQFGRRIHDR